MVKVATVMLVTFGVTMTMAGTSPAQERRGGGPADAVVACREIREDAKRLSCFDAASGVMADARRSGELIVLDRGKVVEQRRRRFGLPSSNALAAADVRGAEVKELNSTIRATQRTRTPGRYTLELADGSMWETLDPTPPPKIGEAIKVTAVRLGGFRAQIGSSRTVMMKRVR